MASPPYEQEYMCDFIHGISQDNNTEPLQKAIAFYAMQKSFKQYNQENSFAFRLVSSELEKICKTYGIRPGDYGGSEEEPSSSSEPSASSSSKPSSSTEPSSTGSNLIESGEKERLKELLRERLVECGWKDEMKAICRTYTKKKGRDKITIDDLINAITPDGRAKVPDSVKKELLQQIESFLSSAL